MIAKASRCQKDGNASHDGRSILLGVSRLQSVIREGGPMQQTEKSRATDPAISTSKKESASFVLGFWGVRYQVKDVSRSIDFYTRQLGFTLDAKHLPAFGQVSIGNLKL